MKVWVVMADSWNGEHSAMSVDSVWLNKEQADAYVSKMNHQRTSSYSSIYSVEGAMEVQGG